ncbi:MAG TPA: hypothetical protein VMW63_02055 [Methanoregulaceae archaeon]|nr:hypothetical protein [Methanoregulaceae archaeon]
MDTIKKMNDHACNFREGVRVLTAQYAVSRNPSFLSHDNKKISTPFRLEKRGKE